MGSSYRYERVGITYSDRPVYVVWFEDQRIGVIERVRASTDTKIKGTRLRRPGKGREEWQPACGVDRENGKWKYERSFMPGLSWQTREQAAQQFRPYNHGPMTQNLINRIANRAKEREEQQGG